MLILKTTLLSQVFVGIEMLAANKVDGIEGSNELIKKCEKLLKIRKLLEGLKLFKSGNLKSKKLFKSQKLAKSKKKLSKSENLPNFDTKKNRPSFFTPNIRTVFNRL